MDIPLREREFDVLFAEPVPNSEQNLALDVGEAVLRVIDPDPELQVYAVVAETQQMTDWRRVFQHALDLAGRLDGQLHGLADVGIIGNPDRQALADQPDRLLVDFGIGENDSPADESVRRQMAEEINKPENRGYADNGVVEFKEAVARFMQRQFDVELDPVTEVNHCFGSKTSI